MTQTQDRIECKNCGAVLNDTTPNELESRPPCPHCGHTERVHACFVSDTLELKEHLRMRGKHEGQKNLFIDTRVGDSFFRITQTWNYMERTIDFENNWYFERITNPVTGEVIRECSEPLTEHQGHGDAKHKRSR